MRGLTGFVHVRKISEKMTKRKLEAKESLIKIHFPLQLLNTGKINEEMNKSKLEAKERSMTFHFDHQTPISYLHPSQLPLTPTFYLLQICNSLLVTEP